MLAALASSMVSRRFRLSRGSPPFLAAMMILRAILLQILPRLASVAPLARLILDQCECPAIRLLLHAWPAAVGRLDYTRRRCALQRVRVAMPAACFAGDLK